MTLAASPAAASVPASWRSRQKEQLSQLLYDTALRLFRSHGYESTTVKQITELAGVAKGTFFNHFAGKEQVLARWHREATLDVLTAVRQQAFASAAEAVQALLDGLAESAMKEPELLRMTARNIVASDQLSEEECALDAGLLAFIDGHIAAGKQSGELAPDLDERLFATMILTTLTGTTHEWVVGKASFDIRSALRERVGFLFAAALPSG